MKVFNVILGVFALFGASYCMIFPGKSFFDASWAIAFLLTAWGICSVVNYFMDRSKEKSSVAGLIFGTLGLILGIVCLSGIFVFPIITEVATVAILSCIFVGWLFVSGIDSVVKAFKMKKESGSKWWILTLIMGILVILGGIYGCFHGFFLIRMEGLGIGMLLTLYGVRLISSVFENE